MGGFGAHHHLSPDRAHDFEITEEQLVLVSFRVIMFKRSAKPTKEVSPISLSQLEGIPNSERTELTPKAESPYRPYAEIPAPPTPEYKPYPDKEAPEPPYEPYRDI
jgi:hypothetical protein